MTDQKFDSRVWVDTTLVPHRNRTALVHLKYLAAQSTRAAPLPTAVASGIGKSSYKQNFVKY